MSTIKKIAKLHGHDLERDRGNAKEAYSVCVQFFGCFCAQPRLAVLWRSARQRCARAAWRLKFVARILLGGCVPSSPGFRSTSVRSFVRSLGSFARSRPLPRRSRTSRCKVGVSCRAAKGVSPAISTPSRTARTRDDDPDRLLASSPCFVPCSSCRLSSSVGCTREIATLFPDRVFPRKSLERQTSFLLFSRSRKVLQIVSLLRPRGLSVLNSQFSRYRSREPRRIVVCKGRKERTASEKTSTWRNRRLVRVSKNKNQLRSSEGQRGRIAIQDDGTRQGTVVPRW